ncbi:MAG: cyclic nucleotide-binding domain-containing protein [Kofleriaceae bacterium]
MVVLASAALFFRRWPRREEAYVQEKFAHKLLRKWEWGDQPPSDDLRDIYLLHAERTKQREARLRAYKETVRELVSDGVVSRTELAMLDSLRAQLGVTDRDHQKVLGELTDEERQLFDPAYQGSMELRLQREQYQRDLERAALEAARAGVRLAPATLAALRQTHAVDDAAEAAALADVRGPTGPVAAMLERELVAMRALAPAATSVASGVDSADGASASASVALLRHLARDRARAHLVRALGALAVLADAREVEQVRAQVRRRAGLGADALATLRGVVDDAWRAPLAAALTAVLAEPSLPLAATTLDAIADDGSPHLRAVVAILRSRFEDDASRAALMAALDDPEELVREAAVRSLGARSRLARDLLARVLADPSPRVRLAAVRAVAGGSTQLPAGSLSAVAQAPATGRHATLDASTAVAALTTIERMMLLREVAMFAGLDAEDLEAVASSVDERQLAAGDDLCRVGEPGDAVFLIVRGRVRVLAPDGREVAEQGPGAVIGEMAVFDQAPRSATVRAADPTRVLVVPGEAFVGLLRERPEMAEVILIELVRRMRGLMGAGSSSPGTPIPPPPTAPN